MNTSLAIKVILILGIIALAMWLWYKFWSHFKVPKTGCVCLVSGGIKAGKSTLAVYQAYVEYKRSVRAWRISTFICKLLHKDLPEKPLLYSNVPLGVPYVPLTKSLIERKERFRFKSVIYINEASLVMDNQSFKNELLSEELRVWCKLIGHELHGGKLIIDTQAIGDIAVEVRRNLSEYIYVHHLIKAIPFFLVAKVREERYSEDGVIVNSYNEDVEEKLKAVLIPKNVWKKFDAYCFSWFTDNLNCVENERKVVGSDLKVREIVSFRDYKTLKVQEELKNGNKSRSRWSEVFSKGSSVCELPSVQESQEVQVQGRCGENNGTGSERLED